MSIYELENSSPDWPIAENIKERRQNGTYIPASEAESALRVSVNGSGTLGTGGEALAVEPGTGQVQGSTHTLHSADDRTLDVALPGGNDRRDVVILTDAGTLEVREGRGGRLDWGEGVAANARTFANAYRPPPPDLRGVPGLVIAVVTVRSGQNELDSDAVDSTMRVGPPAGLGEESGIIGGQAIQASLDGRIVAVAPGIGVVDAIDPAAVTNPPQAAIDAIDNVGVAYGRYSGAVNGTGAVLYPPTVVDTPGGITSAGGKAHLGHGIAGSTLRLTDSSGDLFHITQQADAAYSYWDGLTLSGGGNRTGGSGFHWADPIEGGFINVNIGTLAFDEWNGGGALIECVGDGPYGSTWQNLFARSNSHDSPFLRAQSASLYGMDIGLIGCGPSVPDVYSVDIDNTQFGGRIGILNVGGASGRLIRARDSARGEGLHVGWANSEPNQAQTVDHMVSLGGDGTHVIEHLTSASRLDYTNAVELTGDGSGTGPANKRIGQVSYAGSNATVAVTSAPAGPSWYWGSRADIDYGGFDPRAVIPLAERGDPAPANLAGVTGNYGGERRSDDGTNTPSGFLELCLWDSTNSVWRPVSDPTASFS